MLSILKTWVYGFTGIATVMSFMPFAAMLVFLAPFYEISPIQIHFIVKGTKEDEDDDKQRSNDDKQRSNDDKQRSNDDKQRSNDDDDDETVKNTASSTSSSEDSSDRPSETS
jgi:hypothetical protein